MALLGLGLLGTGVKQHYLLLARSQRRVMHAALWLTVIAGMDLDVPPSVDRSATSSG
jgi:hypothetical protein